MDGIFIEFDLVVSLSDVGDLTVGVKVSPGDTHVDEFFYLSRPQFGGVGVDLARKGLRDVDSVNRTELLCPLDSNGSLFDDFVSPIVDIVHHVVPVEIQGISNPGSTGPGSLCTRSLFVSELL